NAEAELKAIHIFQTEDEEIISGQIKQFLEKYLPSGEKADLLISGENGDSRFLKYYTLFEKLAGDNIPVTRFKHMMGEFPAASSMALWLACEIMKGNALPQHMMKTKTVAKDFKKILIYNNYKGLQHSIMLINKVESN
ncbi:MAG: hypothetical protein ABUT20_32205, partial [Bacteroidota bacterium]